MAERGFEARCVEVLRRRGGADDGRASWPAIATSWSATRCSTARGVAAPRRPDRRRRLRHARRWCRTATRSASTTSPTSAIARSCAGRRCSARSAPCRSACAARVGRALRRRSARREPPRQRRVHRRRFAGARARPGCAAPMRRRWSTATPTRRAATSSRRGLVRHVLSDWELDGSSRPRAEVAALERARLRADRARDRARRRCRRGRRRERLVAPLAHGTHARATGDPGPLWQLTLARYPFLAARERRQAGAAARHGDALPRQKEFTGARGLEVTDEMAVAIAAQACLPALELGLEWLDGFVGIVVHEDAVVARREVEDDDGIVHAYDEELSGEAMSGGPVMLAWRDVDDAGESAADGYNVVVHEFAHVIDMRGGVTAGLDDGRSRERARPLAARAGRRVRALRRPRRRRRGDLPRPVRRRGARGVLRRRRRGVLRRPGRSRARGAASLPAARRSSSARIRRAKT